MAKKNFYAVARGRKTGIFTSWDECKQQVDGFSGPKYQGFAARGDAEAWLAEMGIRFDEKPADAQPQPEAASLAADDPPPRDMKTEKSAFGLPTDHCKSAGAPLPAAGKAITLHPDHSSPIAPETDAFCKRYGVDHLSPDQRRAVQSVEGKVLLFAVPGSGKTTVLIARTGYMIHCRGVAPEQIVSLTFTKASANEMKERYRKYFPKDTILPEFRTIHSFAFSVIIPLLRGTGFPIPRRLITDEQEEEQKDGSKKKRSLSSMIFREINHELRAIAKENKEKKVVLLNGRKDREALQTAITGIKNTRMTLAELYGKTIHLHSGQDLPIDRAYDVYQKLCRKHHCMDFDDMLAYALKGLRQHPAVLSALQQQYRYWSIDESQDNSPLQHDLLRLLVGENGNLFMVGDDDQSIYAFRGAKPRRFQEFGMEPGVKVLTMGSNYRSAFGIVKTAETFIKANASHQDKQMQASHTEPGCIRFIYDLHRERHQYERIVSTCRAGIQQGKELAVLYRENNSALPVMFWLEKHGIPFFTSAKLSEILQNPYISRVLNLLSFIAEPNSYRLCVKVQTELGIFPSDEEITQWRKNCSASPERNVLEVLNDIAEYDYSSIIGLLAEAAASAPYQAVLKLMSRFGINPNSQSERMQVNAILSTAMLYDTVPALLNAIKAMKRKLNDHGENDDSGEVSAPIEEVEQQKAKGCAVTLTTMHSAKGLEFDHVMVIDFLAPPDVPFDPKQLVFDDPEEPRRLFYVAMTRAKQTLDILTVQSYHGEIEEPHPFISKYAAICERDELLTEAVSSVPDAEDCALIKVYGKYYGVPVGRVPGVYTTWDDAKVQTNGFPIKQNEQPKVFLTWEEAASYAYPDGIPEEVRPVNLSAFRQYLVPNKILHANWPQDIHPKVTAALLALLKTDNLRSLDEHTISKLRMDYLSPRGQACNYGGGRALAYALNYLPLNYYKVWTPLWRLLKKKRLPCRAKVLELGAGPGTSGMALLDFYSKLAAANPDRKFSIDYTAVEREGDFLTINDRLWNAMLPGLPENLHVSRAMVQADAFRFMDDLRTPTYNMILESNMLNPDEGITEKALSRLRSGFARGLVEHGCAILIEPGRQEQKTLLGKAVLDDSLALISEPEIGSVDISAISLVKQSLEVGLRYKQKREHWYAMVIAERKPS